MTPDTRLLATIYPEDVDPTAPTFDYALFLPRLAGRVIVFNRNKLALVHVKERGYYMLPGGGVDIHEDIVQALEREAFEELGCVIRVLRLVGSIETYFDRWKQKQTDYCYVARKVSADGQWRSTFTDFERSEGFEVMWVRDLDEAIQFIKNAAPGTCDGKLVCARDLLFLECYKMQVSAGFI